MKRSINLIIIAFLVITVTESPLAQSTKSGNMSIALTGDAIITRKLSVYKEPEFLKMIEIIRNADIAFTNLEMLFHDYEAYPMHRSVISSFKISLPGIRCTELPPRQGVFWFCCSNS